MVPKFIVDEFTKALQAIGINDTSKLRFEEPKNQDFGDTLPALL
jgi:hypothetical protein